LKSHFEYVYEKRKLLLQRFNCGIGPRFMKSDNRCEGSNGHGGLDNGCEGTSGIYVNGLEDMGGINFKMLTEDDMKNYQFPNLEVAFTFYNWYARMHGFSARKSKVRRNKLNEVVQQNFVCYREGFRVDRFNNNKIRMREARADT
jgi:hypothetical protein